MSSRQLMRRPERLESILVGAATAFARTGFAATSMEDIGAEAGVTKLMLYRHFAGKQEIYEAVLARVSERLVEAFRAAAGTNKPAAGLEALLTVARSDPDGFVLLFRHAAREPQFATYADGVLARVTSAAQVWLSGHVSDRTVLRWTARVAVRTAIESVIAWLAVGEKERDVEFLKRAERGVAALVAAHTRSV